MSTTQKIRTSPDPDVSGRNRVYIAMAVGRLVMGLVSLAVPKGFAQAVGVSTTTPESTYMTRVYGARAVVMGSAFLTSGEPERKRWTRFSLFVDVSDTVTGIVHLLRRDFPPRTTFGMITLTSSYAVLGALNLTGGKNAIPRQRNRDDRR